jgi:hypothetical protein
MANKLVGRNDIALGNQSDANYIIIAKFIAIATGDVTEIRCRVKASTAGNVILGIYADNAGEPAALLATTASTAVSSDVERVITIALVANLAITNGTVYWIAFNSSAALVGDKTETCVKRYKGLAYGALPNPAGTGYATDTTRNTIASAWGIIASPVIFNSTPDGGKWTVPIGVTSVKVLVIAGGGGGGQGGASAWEGGGGGGGGMVYHSAKATIPGAELTVTIGNGGATDTPGSNSVFDDITALGGGKGGYGSDGGNGGSGGGGTYNAHVGGTAIQGDSGGGTGYGYAGGNPGSSFSGGGGGAGEVGNTDGNAEGGDGRNIPAIDANIYAGGGGGGKITTGGGGGAGGGGAGGTSPKNAGTAGTVNTGGGGGGGYANTGSVAGGAGGSGIVIISYVLDYLPRQSYYPNILAH